MFDRLAHDLLGLASRVRLGAVEEVDAGVPSGLHAGVRVLCVVKVSIRMFPLLRYAGSHLPLPTCPP